METTLLAPPARSTAGMALSGVVPGERSACFHCGEPCADSSISSAGKVFCCQGCRCVYELLKENGLDQFYELNRHPGVRLSPAAEQKQWEFLDEPSVQQRLLDFSDGKISRITLQVPAIHCVACVWLLENLFRLREGLGKSQVNFPKRELSIQFAPEKISLSELVGLLSSIGYEPRLTLGDLEKLPQDRSKNRRWLQIGVAGFAFGNIMLFSLPVYMGLDSLSAPLFKTLFGYCSLALALPVLVFSAADFWRSALLAIRQRMLTLEVPIALGLAAIYAQSAWEIFAGYGPGYLDSLCGLVFFLLCGRAFQQSTHERIAFERDYKCFFPLAVTRKTAAGEESLGLSHLRVGDRLVIRNAELIPADSRLMDGPALIDYSFVTGESEPVAKQPGEYLYAGGQQVGSAIEVETLKPVSQSYLTSLWNHDAFQKRAGEDLNTLTNRYSRRFTRIVIAVAVGAALFWLGSGDSARALRAFTSVLIVACPCALALAAPFALGTAQRLLARLQIFLKNALVLERLARADTIVFDKTGTLTSAHENAVTFHAHAPGGCANPRFQPELNAEEQSWVCSLARHSTHPHAVRVFESFGKKYFPEPVRSFLETPGCGLEGNVNGHEVWLGSRAFLENYGLTIPASGPPPGSVVYLAIDGKFRGLFLLANTLRSDVGQALNRLSQRHAIKLLSGDNERERGLFETLFGSQAELHFNQSPLDKLHFIRRFQHAGRTVMMVGDGLNDAGALKQSDVGVAVVEKVGTFSPASDIILAARQVPRLPELLAFARKTTRVVHVSFGISAVYNVVGISIAAAGLLSPLVCAILMPLSSLSVVLFACGMTSWAARKAGIGK